MNLAQIILQIRHHGNCTNNVVVCTLTLCCLINLEQLTKLR